MRRSKSQTTNKTRTKTLSITTQQFFLKIEKGIHFSNSFNFQHNHVRQWTINHPLRYFNSINIQQNNIRIRTINLSLHYPSCRYWKTKLRKCFQVTHKYPPSANNSEIYGLEKNSSKNLPWDKSVPPWHYSQNVFWWKCPTQNKRQTYFQSNLDHPEPR